MLSEWRDFTAGIAPQHYTMRYQVWQPASPRPLGTVVCVHGLTRNSYDFDRLALTLAQQGYRVICPDVVGRGRSDHAPDPLLYNYATYLNDLQRLLHHERAKNVVWVGTSMGGILGLMVALQNPRQIGKLVLNDVGAFIPQAALERIASYAGNQPYFRTLAEAEDYCRKTYGTFGLRDDSDWEIFTQNSIKPIPGVRGDSDYVLAYDHALVSTFMGVPLTDVNLWPLWEANFAPTLVVRGAQSDLLTREVATAMTSCAHADLIEFDGCGHAPSLMVPDQIDAVVRYIAHPHKRLGPLTFATRTMQRTANMAGAALGKLFKSS